MDTVAGSRVGPYVLGAPLGDGSSGSLHRAVDTGTGRAVALRWDPSGPPDPGEAAALAASAHPHVVALLATGEDGGRPWLALELVDGPDLRTVLGGRPLPPGRAVALLAQLGAAVDAVHAAGFVHLDLKPANVLVAAGPGGTDHAVLADFGLARRHDAPTSGDFVGSPAYAAPEHLRGEPVGPAADVYAFTCLAVACLTGRPPHAGGVAAVVGAHHAGVVPPTGLGAGVDAVVRRGMAADPAQRFPSAGAVVRAFAPALGTDPGAAPVPGGPGVPLAPPPPRRLRAPIPPASGGWADGASWGTGGGRSSAAPVLVGLALLVLAVAVVIALVLAAR